MNFFVNNNCIGFEQLCERDLFCFSCLFATPDTGAFVSGMVSVIWLHFSLGIITESMTLKIKREIQGCCCCCEHYLS